MTSTNYLIYGFILLLAILIIVSIIKKVFKLLIFIIALLIAFSAYNILVKGVSPLDEFNGYIKDFNYGKSITDYTGKIKDSVEKIKNVVESGRIGENTQKVISTENANLHKYEKEVQGLQHTKGLDIFHEKYCDFLKDIVDSSDGAAKIANSSQGKSISVINGTLDKLSSSIDSLINLNINDYKK